jgi:hypothetical protein
LLNHNVSQFHLPIDERSVDDNTVNVILSNVAAYDNSLSGSGSLIKSTLNNRFMSDCLSIKPSTMITLFYDSLVVYSNNGIVDVIHGTLPIVSRFTSMFPVSLNFNIWFSQSLIPSFDYILSSSYLFEVNSLLILPLFETINIIVTSIDVIHC